MHEELLRYKTHEAIQNKLSIFYCSVFLGQIPTSPATHVTSYSLPPFLLSHKKIQLFWAIFEIN